MTFQRRTRDEDYPPHSLTPTGVRIVVGGYDPSLASDAYTDPSAQVDFIVRGEGR